MTYRWNTMGEQILKTEHGPVGRMMVEITDLKETIKRFENENQKLKEEIEKLRSLLSQDYAQVENLRR